MFAGCLALKEGIDILSGSPSIRHIGSANIPIWRIVICYQFSIWRDFVKSELHILKIAFMIFLLGTVLILIKYKTCITETRSSAWYAPLTEIIYYGGTGKGDVSEDNNASFSLDENGKFEFIRGETVCCGQFEKDIPLESQVLDPQRNLYSFSFRIPCSTHADHTFYFTIYPNDLNSFTVNVETSSTDTEMLWLTANNSATLTVPVT